MYRAAKAQPARTFGVSYEKVYSEEVLSYAREQDRRRRGSAGVHDETTEDIEAYVYSVEFFRRLGRKLKPGGLVCSWAPTPRVFQAIQQTFPHVIGTPNRVTIIASFHPVAVDPLAWMEREFLSPDPK